MNTENQFITNPAVAVGGVASLMGQQSLDLGDCAGLLLDMFGKTYMIPKFPIILPLNMASVSSAGLVAAQQIMRGFQSV